MKTLISEKSSQYKRLLAIGDIHGCFFHFRDLLTVVKPTKDDLIVTLGDYIDRGPYSREVIEELIRLHANPEINIVSLRGNHDALMLMCANGLNDCSLYYPQPNPSDIWHAVAGYTPAKLWQNNGGIFTMASYCPGAAESDLAAIARKVPPEHIAFLRDTCADACETEDYIFVHGGLRPDRSMGEQALFDLHWLRFDDPRPQPHISGKKVVCGHTIQRDFHVRDIGHAICVDTGACLQQAGGKLSCVDVKTGKVWQTDGFLPQAAGPD